MIPMSAGLAGATPDGRDVALRTTLFVAGMVAATLYLVFSVARSTPGGILEDVYALLLLWVAAVPTWQFFVLRRRTTPFFAAICAIYGLYFGLPRFNERPLYTFETWQPPYEAVGPALAVALVGVSALVVGFHISGPLLRRVPRMTRAVDLTRALPLLLVGSSISVALHLGGRAVPTGLIQPLLVIQAIGEMCMAGMLLAHLRGLLPRRHQVFLVALVVVQLLSGLLSGALANALWPVAGLAFVYAWERRRLPITPMLVMIIAFVPLNAAKQEFRARFGPHTSGGPSPTVVQRANGFISATTHVLEDMSFGEMRDISDQRLAHLAELAAVVYQTPSRVPYWDGYSYRDLLWHFVPRLFVPDKPMIEMGQEFPKRYAFLNYEDVGTSFNLPQLVECYVNFGVVGVVFGMAFIGMIYRLMDHSFVVNSGGVILASTLYSRLLNVESHFASVFGSLPLFALILYGFLRLLPSEESSSRQPSQ
jgi:hypothetical protein